MRQVFYAIIFISLLSPSLPPLTACLPACCGVCVHYGNRIADLPNVCAIICHPFLAPAFLRLFTHFHPPLAQIIENFLLPHKWYMSRGEWARERDREGESDWEKRQTDVCDRPTAISDGWACGRTKVNTLAWAAYSCGTYSLTHTQAHRHTHRHSHRHRYTHTHLFYGQAAALGATLDEHLEMELRTAIAWLIDLSHWDFNCRQHKRMKERGV